jgi:hypothetical protein
MLAKNAGGEQGESILPEVNADLILRAIAALEPLKIHHDLVLELKRIASGPPEAWAIDWLDGLDPRRKTFLSEEHALVWLEDRRGFNTELATATMRPLFAL